MITDQSPARFYLLGDVHIECATLAKTMNLPRSTERLLGYLLIHRDRFHSREMVADRLWGEQDGERARQRVNTALWRLRALVSSSPHLERDLVIQSAGGAIKFNTEIPYWLDVEVLESALKGILEKRVDQLTRSHVVEAEAALELYRGDLLEPHNIPWAIVERERMRAVYVDALAILAEYRMRENEFVPAVALGRRALSLEPLREDIHRIVIEAYARSGRTPEALRQFEACRKLLDDELEITPARETLLLRERILGAVTKPARATQLLRSQSRALGE